MNEVTYSWDQFFKITDQIFHRLISRLKISKAGVKSEINMEHSELSSKRSSLDPVDIDISSEFFSERFLPLLHKTIMNNVKIGSKGILNLIISLRIALMQESLSQDEYNLILSLLVK